MRIVPGGVGNRCQTGVRDKGAVRGLMAGLCQLTIWFRSVSLKAVLIITPAATDGCCCWLILCRVLHGALEVFTIAHKVDVILVYSWKVQAQDGDAICSSPLLLTVVPGIKARPV